MSLAVIQGIERSANGLLMLANFVSKFHSGACASVLHSLNNTSRCCLLLAWLTWILQ